MKSVSSVAFAAAVILGACGGSGSLEEKGSTLSAVTGTGEDDDDKVAATTPSTPEAEVGLHADARTLHNPLVMEQTERNNDGKIRPELRRKWALRELRFQEFITAHHHDLNFGQWISFTDYASPEIYKSYHEAAVQNEDEIGWFCRQFLGLNAGPDEIGLCDLETGKIDSETVTPSSSLADARRCKIDLIRTDHNSQKATFWLECKDGEKGYIANNAIPVAFSFSVDSVVGRGLLPLMRNSTIDMMGMQLAAETTEGAKFLKENNIDERLWGTLHLEYLLLNKSTPLYKEQSVPELTSVPMSRPSGLTFRQL